LDNKTIRDWDATYHVLDGDLTDQIQDIRNHVDKLKPTTVGTLSDSIDLHSIWPNPFISIFDTFFLFTPHWHIVVAALSLLLGNLSSDDDAEDDA